MAIGVIGGLIVSTVLSLVFVPSLYTFMDDLGRWTGRALRRLLTPRDAVDTKQPTVIPGHPADKPATDPRLQIWLRRSAVSSSSACRAGCTPPSAVHQHVGFVRLIVASIHFTQHFRFRHHNGSGTDRSCRTVQAPPLRRRFDQGCSSGHSDYARQGRAPRGDVSPGFSRTKWQTLMKMPACLGVFKRKRELPRVEVIATQGIVGLIDGRRWHTGFLGEASPLRVYLDAGSKRRSARPVHADV